MIDRLDQIFVLLKHWILGYLPGSWQTPAGVILSVVCIIGLYPALFALTTVLERKGVGRIQNRLGPNRVGPYGILQPIADGIKSLTKEDIVPTSADAVVHFLAPIVLVITVFMGFAVLPMGRNMVLVDMDAGLLFYFAMGASIGAFGIHGGVVEPQQVFAAGRDARGGADDQLRSGAAAVERGDRDDDRLTFAGKDCGSAESLQLRFSALVHLYAVGICRVSDVCDCGYGGDESLAV